VIFDDLVAEQERLEAFLQRLTADEWMAASGAAGWTVADVVLHLAQTEEATAATATRGGGPIWDARPGSVEDVMDQMVRAERAAPAEIFERWRRARRAAVTALRNADPQQRLAWVASPLKPATLATTRLAEHWAHGLDITGPLGIDFPDTNRLRHVAWLAHSTLPYGFGLVGLKRQPVYCELVAPDRSLWRFGPPDAESRVTGPAGGFCRVGARRLEPAASGLTATGPYGAAALRVLRNFAA
jgi:uncharacterized protein (TIGR03084 family)